MTQELNQCEGCIQGLIVQNMKTSVGNQLWHFKNGIINRIIPHSLCTKDRYTQEENNCPHWANGFHCPHCAKESDEIIICPLCGKIGLENCTCNLNKVDPIIKRLCDSLVCVLHGYPINSCKKCLPQDKKMTLSEVFEGENSSLKQAYDEATQDKRCKPCQLENNLGTCDRNDCSNYSQDNGDWEQSLDNMEREYPMAILNWSIEDWKRHIRKLLRSQRQSDKELILGKMEHIDTCDKVCMCGDFYAEEDIHICVNGIKNETIDTCKSIVEEVLHG